MNVLAILHPFAWKKGKKHGFKIDDGFEFRVSDHVVHIFQCIAWHIFLSSGNSYHMWLKLYFGLVFNVSLMIY